MAKIINQSEITTSYVLPDQSTKEVKIKSNESMTENMTTSFTKVRSTAKEFGEGGDEIEQTLVLTNNTEYSITGVQIMDTIGSGVTFKEGSVTIDEEPKADLNPLNGFNLEEDIAKNSSVTIKYIVEVDNDTTEPSAEIKSKITYSVNEISDLEEYSNAVTITLTENNITIVKTSDKTAVISGQKLTFQNVIENKGKLKNTNITFKDQLPEDVEFVVGSVMIDGVSQGGSNPTVGFAVQDLEPNEKVTVTFEVTVK